MFFAVEDPNHAGEGMRTDGFGISRLKIPGKVREESAGDLDADAVAGEKCVASNHASQVQAGDAFSVEIVGL